jgi:hypothetical protein
VIDKIEQQNKMVLASISVKNSDGRLFRIRRSNIFIKSQWKEVDGEWLLYRVQWERTD